MNFHSLQLISEIAQAHILYDVCVVAAPKPDCDDPRRFRLEEYIQLSAPPGRPYLDCFVSQSLYVNYLSLVTLSDL